MPKKRLRISIVGLLLAVAIVSFGCGGGGSGTTSAPGGAFIPAVMPDVGSTTGAESENVPDGSLVNTQSSQQITANNNEAENGENEPDSTAQNTQTEQQVADNGKQEDNGENVPTSTIISPPNDGGNPPDDSNQNTNENQEENTENIPASLPQNLQNWQHLIEKGYVLQEVDFQIEDLPLPWEHGIEEGEIFVDAGETNRYGNLLISCPSETGNRPLSCYLFVGEDGSVVYQSPWGAPEFKHIPTGGFPDLPLPHPDAAKQAPIVDLGTALHVGAGVAPNADDLTKGVNLNGIPVSYGEVRDGVGANVVLDFMQQHVAAKPDLNIPPGLATFPDPPTIRLAEGTSDLYARYAAHAVQLINSALPYGKRITISTETIESQEQLSEGEIYIEFGAYSSSIVGVADRQTTEHFNDERMRNEVQKTEHAGILINEGKMREVLYAPSDNDEEWEILLPDARMKDSDTHINLYSDDIFFAVVVHELIHALGFSHVDVSRFAESIMNPNVSDPGRNEIAYSPIFGGPVSLFIVDISGTLPDNNFQSDSERSATVNTAGILPDTRSESDSDNNLIPRRGVTRARPRVPGHILLPIDRAALLAAYGRFDPGTQPEELTAENLGDWTDKSFHLRGDVEFPGGGAAFGVASANGFAQPWAAGSTPWTNLEDNEALSGSVMWNGALFGVSSSSETVAGNAGLTVNLSSLTGRIDFTGMEKWGVGEAPGAVGSGETWGDGDLGYTVAVRGNTFTQTGGDIGQVTGAFFGPAHEAVGGVLERADLAAGFGGKR